MSDTKNQAVVYDELFYTDGVERAMLKEDGEFSIRRIGTRDWEIHPWYKNEKTGNGWIPKRKNFRSLVKQMIREGDFKL